jgi:TolB-like protein
VKVPFRNPTLVVLPTKVNGPVEFASLANAIPDTLSTLLAGVRGVETMAPPSSVDLERLKGDTEKVAAAYGADHLLLTAVTVQGDRLLLNAQLIQVRSRRVRWATHLEGSLGSCNELLQEVVVGIARELKPAGNGESPLGRSTFGSRVELALREGQ